MAHTDTEPLLVERRDDRVLARLNRPHVRNAIDEEMVRRLHRLCAELERHPRVLILTGADGVFASGADITQLREHDAERARAGDNTAVIARVGSLPMPVIAALDGYALGAGAELAYAADIRIGTPDVRIGNPEPGLGIIAAAGATWRLPQLIGSARASQMLLTGRIVDADQALQWGLLAAIHPRSELLTAAHTLVDRIVDNDPTAVAHTKTALRAPSEAHPEIDLELQAELFESPEKRRRMTAFLQRRRHT